MISKEEAVSKLVQKGIEARYENNIVMVYSDELTFEDLQRELKSINYDASYGLRSIKELKHDKSI